MAGLFERLFGLNITSKANTNQIKPDEKTFALPENRDGSLVVQTGGHFGTYVDIDGASTDDISLITRYREMAQMAEIETAIMHILDDAIVSEDTGKTVSINLDDVDSKEKLKKQIEEEFKNVLRLLNFNELGHEIFKRWYVDGRLFYHVVIDEKNPKAGIKQTRYIDPRRIKKIREIKKGFDAKTGMPIVQSEREYYLYNERGMIGIHSNLGAKINPDAVVYVHSGLIDAKSPKVLSHLHKAIKPLNNLRMVEDATVIYRLSRAPERRVFYIDVSNMPTHTAEQYLKAQMNKFRNKIVYDAQTGEVRDERKFMSMIEDFWLPRRDGGKGTEITTLPGGQSLGRIEDVEYMQDKLYKALNIPAARFQNPAGGFSLGKTTEITRDEIAFAKFIQRLRKRFSGLFMELLRRQLILKEIIKEDEWDEVSENIWFDFIKDNNFEEFRDMELLRERVATLQLVDPYVGRYYSMEWVRKNILQLTDEDIEEIQKQIDKEKEDGTFVDPMEQQQAMMNQPPMTPDLPPPQPQLQLPAPNAKKAPQENNDEDYSRFAPKTNVGK